MGKIKISAFLGNIFVHPVFSFAGGLRVCSGEERSAPALSGEEGGGEREVCTPRTEMPVMQVWRGEERNILEIGTWGGK